MKLAEALLLRAEYQQKTENLKNRILQNLTVQEGEKPPENPESLLSELSEVSDKLCELIKKINARNNTAKLPDGRTLSDALVEREMLMKKRQILSNIALAASQSNSNFRYSPAEIKIITMVSVEDIQKQIDGISKKFRELDMQIQGLNWIVDL